LDVGKIRENLSRADERELSEAEVASWLTASGFIRDGEWWWVMEAELGAVDPEEVVELVVESDKGP